MHCIVWFYINCVGSRHMQLEVDICQRLLDGIGADSNSYHLPVCPGGDNDTRLCSEQR